VCLSMALGAGNREGLFGMFACYFDASNQDRDRVFAVGGFISTVREWNDFFDPEWRDYLGRYGITELHMKEYNQCRGEFVRFKGESELRNEFMAGCIEVIKKRARYSIGRVLTKNTWREANELFKLKESKTNEYTIAGLCCMLAGRRLAKQRQVEYIFHEGDAGWGRLQALARGRDFPEPISRPNRDRKGVRGLVQLQPADLIAYEGAREYVDNEGSSLRRWRKSFQSLSQIDGDWRTLSLDDVKEFCVKSKIPERKDVKK
jgi:hypothetical protein